MLRTFIQVHALVQGMDIGAAKTLYRTFVEAKWTFARVFVPFTGKAAQRIEAIGTGFVPAVLTSCKAKGLRLRRARALMKMDSQLMTRVGKSHKLVEGLLRAARSDEVPDEVGRRAKLILEAHNLKLTLKALAREGGAKETVGK